MTTPAPPAPNNALDRVIGLPGAVFMGLGSILGTGIFVSIGVAAAIAGPSVLLAVAIAAIVAAFNGLASASLAANHPVSGGTYVYGYRYLNAPLGFTAGWMFLCAKSASAATAALGFAGYALSLAGENSPTLRVAIALGLLVTLTILVAGGASRSNRLNTIIVLSTLGALATFIIAGLLAPTLATTPADAPATPDTSAANIIEASALLFVAYTGYGRIATLGEEVRNPRTAVPRAIIITLLATMAIYLAVTWVAVETVGASGLAAATGTDAAPLVVVAGRFNAPAVPWIVSAGALTAMAGVLLNLLLGLSRVMLAMARESDMPAPLAVIHNGSPRRAVIVVGAIIALLVLIGNVRTTWTFSAFTVLVYYAITNLAALRLPAANRLFPAFVPALGLISCLSLAFFVDTNVWLVGLGIIAAGLAWHGFSHRRGN